MHASCMLCSTQHETLTCREYQDMLHISNDPTSRAARQNFIVTEIYCGALLYIMLHIDSIEGRKSYSMSSMYVSSSQEVWM